jgi:hypothetical protein
MFCYVICQRSCENVLVCNENSGNRNTDAIKCHSPLFAGTLPTILMVCFTSSPHPIYSAFLLASRNHKMYTR